MALSPLSTWSWSEYSVPISERKRPVDWPRTIGFSVLFNVVIFSAHGLLWTLIVLYPFAATRPYYERGVQYFKNLFGRLIVVISQFFAPTKLVISCSDEQGNIVDPEKLVQRDSKGRIVHVNLPDKSVWMSNHQVYTDWLYLWNLSYFGGLSDSIVIILLKLYKWFPVIGVSMQMYRFIFLTRKWDSDKHYLARHLSKIARLASDKVQTPGARGAASKLLLLIFPEGTLVSPLTRPISKKFADKSGIEDCKNMLLPRSTGLLFALRTLAADISDLKLVDFTIGYPGVPSPGRAQEFYTLRSTFMQGVGPPAVHMHFTVLSLQPSAANAPPLGTLPATAALAAKDESTPEEHAAFDSWLLNRWRQKDEQMSRFYRDGDFLGGAWHAEHAKSKAGPAFNGPEEMPASEKTAAPVPYIEIPVRLINTTELWHLFWGFYVFAGFYALYRVCVYYHA